MCLTTPMSTTGAFGRRYAVVVVAVDRVGDATDSLLSQFVTRR